VGAHVVNKYRMSRVCVTNDVFEHKEITATLCNRQVLSDLQTNVSLYYVVPRCGD